MPEQYNVETVVQYLKRQKEMHPDRHDGCYELMRETILSYGRHTDFSILDYKDLNLIYLTTVGTFRQGIDLKRKMVEESNLLPEDKKNLVQLWNKVWAKAGQKAYSNFEPTAKEGYSIGLFGTGFFTFKGYVTKNQVQDFIQMCVDILPMTDDQRMFNRAEKTLSNPIGGMQAAAASMILHVLKPFSFPVLNANTGNKNIFEVLGVKLVKPGKLETYIDNCRKIKAFRDKNFTCKNYRIYDIAAQIFNRPEQSDEWWPSLAEYDPGIAAEQYYKLFLDKSVTNKEWLEALYDLYQMPKHLGTCADLESRFNKPYARYNRFLTSLARRIREKTSCPVPKDQDSSAYWPVLFQGKSVENDDSHKGIYCWKMREPVVKAMEMFIEEGVFTEVPMNTAVSRFDHNLILYGPPGTGKTYYSVIYAVAICDGKSIEEVSRKPYSETLARYKELKEEGRIAFTTFHQSYGYEEFIEGIKPRLDSESESLGYTIEDGIFKEFCKRANSTKAHANDSLDIKQNPHIWGMLLGGTGATEIKRDCFENSVIRFGWDRISDADVMEDDVDDTKLDRFAKHQTSNFIYSMEAGDVVVIAKSITTIDAIGVITGEYEYDETKESYCRTRKVKWLAKDIEYDILPFLPNGRKKLPTSYLYPLDYIGIDAVSSILDELNGDSGIYLEHETEPYVFIIDEINRGNISKIFGELITLIEETKRAGAAEAMEAILPYSGEPFTVPNNVFILGTMNTADRSIALMDTALRRRFEFREMMPDSKVLDKLGVGTITIDGVELNVSRMLDVINERIEYLFDREHTIGHAFFSKLANDCSIETLASIFEKNVVPLLQEYFYEDYEKIQLVLGDNSKEDEFKFILDYPIKVKDIFNGSPDIDLPEKGYSIQHDAFLKLDSYKKIGRDL